MNKNIVFILEMSLFILVGCYLIGLLHEQAHIEIYKSYGIESHMDLWSDFPNLLTIADKPCPNDLCTLAHNLNEIIGYTTQGFLAGLGYLFILLRLSKGDED